MDQYTRWITIISLLEAMMSMLLCLCLFATHIELLGDWWLSCILIWYGYLMVVAIVGSMAVGMVLYLISIPINGVMASLRMWVFVEPVGIFIYRWSNLGYPIVYMCTNIPDGAVHWFMIYKLCWSTIENIDALYQYCIKNRPTPPPTDELDQVRREIQEHYGQHR